MLWVPGGASNFSWRVDSIGTTRPAAALGATVTPAQNSKGSYAQVFSALARDVFFLLININSNNVAAAARDTIIDIGVDPAGGTSYSVLIPDLLGSCASSLGALSATAGTGIWYGFPIWIKAGSTVGARASVNNATVGTCRVRGFAFGSPKRRDRVKVGTKVTAYGITAASSRGTLVTPGTTSEGAWTSLGSITQPAWWWQLGVGVNDSTMGAVSYFADLGIGDASNKFAVIENEAVLSSGSEALSKEGSMWGCEFDVPGSGQTVYGRLQCSGTADSNVSMAAYAVT
jgi:hypothetical protein